MIDPTSRSTLRPSGVSLPRLAVGLSSLGGLFAEVDDSAGVALFDAALAAGLDYFDVAPSYGYGLAEQRAGEALAGRTRADYTLSTKVGKLVRPAPARAPDEPFVGAPPGTALHDYSAPAIRRSLEESLARLGLDAVDILYIHDAEDHLEAAAGDAFPVLAKWRDEGVVRAIGFGMNDATALQWLVERTDPDVVLAANCYTLLDQSAAGCLFPLCERREIAVVAGGPYSSGILADPVSRPFYLYRPASPEIMERTHALQRLTETHGVALRVAALQFVARHAAVTTTLVGARDATELRAALDAFATDVPSALWTDLEASGLLTSEAAYTRRTVVE
jgi:D-threo-aldose 1-dehydrogenase